LWPAALPGKVGGRVVRLFRAPWSTNVERVALALAHKGVEVESVVIDYAHREPVVEVSGQPLVPVLDDDGVVVADSRRILRHLEATRPDPPLFPREPRPRAELDVFFEWFDEVWKGPPNAIAEELDSGSPDHEEVARLSARMDGWLDVVDGLLDGRDHLLGGFSAADCLAYPFLRYAALDESPDDETFHHVLIDHLSVEGRPRLAAWIERVGARPRV
jgi:glutathione S-transferase